MLVATGGPYQAPATLSALGSKESLVIMTVNKLAQGIGTRIRGARLKKKLSLEQVSELTGLSISLISKIEREITAPSVRSLLALIGALDIPLEHLFDQTTDSSQESGLVVRAGERRRLDFGEKRLVKELLTPQPIGSLELLMVILAPGGSTGDDIFSHNGEEAGMVLTGCLELWVDGQTFLLHPGDSFAFPSVKPHRFRNAAEVETRVLWVNTPPLY
jgi:transcriptional regulator with XRE-family HTH domain